MRLMEATGVRPKGGCSPARQAAAWRFRHQLTRTTVDNTGLPIRRLDTPALQRLAFSGGQLFGRGDGGASAEPSIEERLAKRQKRTKASAVAASATFSVAAVVAEQVPPWGAIGAAVLAAVGLGLTVGNALRRKGDLALTGDARAIAGFMRRSAKWSPEKRKRKAVKLHAELKKVNARIDRQRGRRKKGAKNHALVAQAKLKLKLGALVAQEIQTKENPNRPLVKGDPETIPAQAALDRAANADSPSDDVDPPEFAAVGLGGGGLVGPALLVTGVVMGGLFLVWLSNRGAAGAARRAA